MATIGPQLIHINTRKKNRGPFYEQILTFKLLFLHFKLQFFCLTHAKSDNLKCQSSFMKWTQVHRNPLQLLSMS